MSNLEICKDMYKKGFRLSLESGKHNGTFFYTEQIRSESERLDVSVSKIAGTEFVPGKFLDAEFEQLLQYPSQA
mgnify:CR=1 FL=1